MTTDPERKHRFTPVQVIPGAEGGFAVYDYPDRTTGYPGALQFAGDLTAALAYVKARYQDPRRRA